MVRRYDERIHEKRKMFGGEGEVLFHRILNGPDEMYGKGRVFSHAVLEKGAEVAWHVHHGDGETYLILKGEGLYNDNGVQRRGEAGDVTFTDDGEGHALRGISDEPLEAIALVLYK